MGQPRKWVHVGTEAIRLHADGLSRNEIAARLGVHRSSILRWIRASKLAEPGTTRLRQPAVLPDIAQAANWADQIRHTYVLDATDDELVTLAQAALDAAHNPKELTSIRLGAAGRFQALVKHLALSSRSTAADLPAPVASPPPRPPRLDPREQLLRVQ